jgi:hypothetical protein
MPDDGSISSPTSKKVEFLKDLIAHIEEPDHKRILKAYNPDAPVESLEAELSRILMEIVKP